MVKVEIVKPKPVENEVVIRLLESEARGLMRYLVDGPDWCAAPGGREADQFFGALERAGLREA